MRQTTACRGSADDPARFLKELRQLRNGAGLGPAELAARAHYPYDRITAAEAGPALPDLPVLSAYVRGCGGTTEEWEERWRSLTSAQTLPLLAARPAGSSTAASAGARIGSISPAADTPDPSIILAALDRVAEGMAVGEPAALPPSADGEEAVGGTAASMGSVDAGDTSVRETSATRTAWGTTAASTGWGIDAEPTVGAEPAAFAEPAVGAEPAAGEAPGAPARAVPTVAEAAVGASGRTGPALSRSTILVAVVVAICVLVALLATFA